MRHSKNRPGPYLVTTAKAAPVALPAWVYGQIYLSPDGRQCAVANTLLTPGDWKTNALVVFPTADPTKRTVLHKGAGEYAPVCWSPDSKAIAAVLQGNEQRGPDAGLWTFPVP